MEIVKTFLCELGVTTPKNTRGYRIRTHEELEQKVTKLKSGGFRISAILGMTKTDSHAVGLQDAGGGDYDTLSTWSPFENDVTSLKSIFDCLQQSPRYRLRETNNRRTVVDTNIFVLPPEPHI